MTTRAFDESRPAGGAANADADWTQFDPGDYFAHNYAVHHQNDLDFVGEMRDFFAAALAGSSRRLAVDVGAGTNLYPALAMLPFAKTITLYDHAPGNRAWLGEEIERGYGESWDGFWRILAESGPYRDVEDPRAQLREKAEIRPGSVFHLGGPRYDLGAMFFVAESISDHHAEFENAIAGFFGVLQPGSPFAMAFMENSEGYHVNGRRFPAVGVDDRDVAAAVGVHAELERVVRRDSGGTPLRDGYTGMILVCGKKK